MNKIPAIESEDKHVFFSREQMIQIKVSTSLQKST